MVFSRKSLPGDGFDLWSLNPFILGIADLLTVVGLSSLSGAAPSRKILERTNHSQSRLPGHPDWPLCLGSPSDL
jgi:hypothetical protein